MGCMKANGTARATVETMLCEMSDAEIEAHLAALRNEATYAAGSRGAKVMRELLCWMEVLGDLKAVA